MADVWPVIVAVKVDVRDVQGQALDHGAQIVAAALAYVKVQSPCVCKAKGKKD